MATFLFNEVVFGPVISRRLGNSLGINLLPVNSKYCNYNCLYCECGLTEKDYGSNKQDLPSRKMVKTELEKTLAKFQQNHTLIDTITFAGNGEPTMNPDFPDIIDDTIELKNKYFPDSKIAVLSNATLIHKPSVFSSLEKIDYNILKLDSAIDETLSSINCPMGDVSVKKLIEGLSKFKTGLTIQTLFVRGTYNGKSFDNTAQAEIKAWLETLNILQPELVMIYTISRDTPIESITKIPESRLRQIAGLVEQLGLSVSVSA